MADFDFFSDTDESAVEEVISQAQDLCVLEQLSSLNCSAFSDSVLPSDLESRFRRLKSFPVTQMNRRDQDHIHMFDSTVHSPHWKSNQPVPPPSSPPSVSDDLLTPSVPTHRSSSNRRPFASPLPLDSSPPQKWGCFWCSPKKLSKKNNKEHDNAALYSDEYVSTFSVNEQQKMLNKAIKEQEKISREAEKIVNWAKQVSARMTSPAIENELSHSSDGDDGDELEPKK